MGNEMRLAIPVLGAIILLAGGSSPARAQGVPAAIPSRLAALEETVATLQGTVVTLQAASAAQAAALAELQTHAVNQQSTVAALQLAVAALQGRQPALRLTAGSSIVENGHAFRWAAEGLSRTPVWFNDAGDDAAAPMWDPTRDRIIRIPKNGLYFVNVTVQTDQSRGIDEGRTLSLRRVGSNPLTPCSGGQVLAATHDATYDPTAMLFPFTPRSLRLTAAIPLQGADEVVVCHSFNGGAFNREFISRAVTSYLEVIFLAPLPQ